MNLEDPGDKGQFNKARNQPRNKAPRRESAQGSRGAFFIITTTMKAYFSVEKSCGENHYSIHLYFGKEVRIQIADSIGGFDRFVEQMEKIAAEIKDTYPRGINL